LSIVPLIKMRVHARLRFFSWYSASSRQKLYASCNKIRTGMYVIYEFNVKFGCINVKVNTMALLILRDGYWLDTV